jgi:hypothetical protein
MKKLFGKVTFCFAVFSSLLGVGNSGSEVKFEKFLDMAIKEHDNAMKIVTKAYAKGISPEMASYDADEMHCFSFLNEKSAPALADISQSLQKSISE